VSNVQPTRRSWAALLKNASAASFIKFSGVYATGVIVVIFAVWTPTTFLTTTTFRSVASEQSITAILALGVLLAATAGVYDLSIGGVIGFSIILVAWLQSSQHMSPTLAVILTVVCGFFIGIVNAFFVIFMRVNSFIATLGMGSVLTALTVSLSGNQTIVNGISPSFLKISGQVPFGIPIDLIYVLVLAVVLWIVLERTTFGRRVAAVGGNQEAARLAGLPVEVLISTSLIASATVASIGGVLYTSLVGSAPLDVGQPFLLPVYAAVFLGATQFRPGRMNVAGTLLAIALLAIGVKGLQLVGAPEWVADAFNGGALVISVALANFRRRALRTRIS
jgi:ribose transport system permease protein